MRKHNKVFLILGILALTVSCAVVGISRNPDYNYSSTKPSEVLIYDQFEPNYPYLIIGKISVDPNWRLSTAQVEKKIRKKAAEIGGDAVIITDYDVNITAFNKYQTLFGEIDSSANQLNFFMVSQETTHAIPMIYLYGYIIKRY